MALLSHSPASETGDLPMAYARPIAVGNAGLTSTCMVAAFQVLINCFEESDALLPGQFPDALGVYMEMVKSRRGDVSDMTLAVLHDIRAATLD
jgi:hypothetical protein